MYNDKDKYLSDWELNYSATSQLTPLRSSTPTSRENNLVPMDELAQVVRNVVRSELDASARRAINTEPSPYTLDRERVELVSRLKVFESDWSCTVNNQVLSRTD
jgi:hypothetical protein